MAFEFGVDIAHFSVVPRQDQMQDWFDQGIRFVIVGCQKDSTAHSQLQALRDFARFELEAYQYYLWDGSAAERTLRALQIMRDFDLKRLWVDVEEARGAVSPEQVCAEIRSAVGAATSAGFAAGIYTGGWCYPGITGGATEFSHLPLWHAAYPNNRQPPNFDTFKPYGNWTRPTIWQYVGTTDLCGVNVDLNVREVTSASAGSTQPGRNEGWMREGNFQVLYNRGVAVIRVGSTDGELPGRVSKLFGQQWRWLRDEGGRAHWSDEEGD